MKLSQLPIITEVSDIDTFVGVRDEGAGVFSDKRYTAGALAGTQKKAIIVGTGGTTLTDDFFSNTITEIVMNNQVYLSDDDFIQTGTTITGVTISFTSGTKLIAKL